MEPTPDVVVIGGGVIGMSVAWRLGQRGARVVVVDPQPGGGATGTAAGMLAPVTEMHYGEEALLTLNLASARRYPDFVGELEDATGLDIGYRRSGTVVAAWDGADLRSLHDLLSLQRRLGLTAEPLDASQLRELEPQVAPGLPGGMFAADDHAVDPRRLHHALALAAGAHGVTIRTSPVVALRTDPVTVDVADGRSLSPQCCVVTAGAWSAALAGKAAGPPLPVRPVKGQTVRLRADPEMLRHVLRGSVRGQPVYLVPRGDGEVVVGATSEEAGFDIAHRAGAVLDLLRFAQALLPPVSEAAVVELSTSLRPATPDNAPLIGAADVPGVFVATGHYRNGVLLAPVTADAVATLVLDGTVPEEVATFGLGRFATTVGGSR